VIVSEPKTVKGRRVIALDPGTVEVLKTQAARQLEEQTESDDAGVETGLVFTAEHGAALDPESVSRYFRQTVKQSLLPQIRLHDLRHMHATLALQAGIHPKVVSERLGHATISITLNTYSHAIPAMQEEAPALIAGLASERPGAVTPLVLRSSAGGYRRAMICIATIRTTSAATELKSMPTAPRRAIGSRRRKSAT
jgi:integrase